MQELNWHVSVTTNIDQQIITSTGADAGFRSRRQERRFLQGDTDTAGTRIKPLLIKFDATVDFLSVPTPSSDDVSAEDLIGEAFNSVSDREMYRNELLAADSVFRFVTAVQIRVEGAVPIEEQFVSQAPGSSGNTSMVGVIVGIVIGGVLLLVAFLIVVRRRRRHYYSKDHHQVDKIADRKQQDPNLAAMTAAATTAAAEPADEMVRCRYVVDEIMVTDIDDDAVSAMTSLPGMDGLTVVEDRTVSVNLDYDFVKQQRTDTTDNESEASYDASQSRATMADTSVSRTLLGLDYVEDPTEEEEEDGASFQDAIKWFSHE